MKRATAEERALARCSLYRTLAASLSYPTGDNHRGLVAGMATAGVAAGLLDEATAGALAELDRILAGTDRSELEAAYQRSFTLSYSEDCPLYETAFSASHLFQQTSHLADLAGFYTAFGVGAHEERADHIAVQLEFCYLLAVKEARAREEGDDEGVGVCREAQRSFLSDHLLRWGELAGKRIEVVAAHPFYAAAGRLLLALLAFEERYLRLSRVARYRDEPAPALDEPGDMTCPIADTAVESIVEMLKGKEEDHRRVTIS